MDHISPSCISMEKPGSTSVVAGPRNQIPNKINALQAGLVFFLFQNKLTHSLHKNAHFVFGRCGQIAVGGVPIKRIARGEGLGGLWQDEDADDGDFHFGADYRTRGGSAKKSADQHRIAGLNATGGCCNSDHVTALNKIFHRHGLFVERI